MTKFLAMPGWMVLWFSIPPLIMKALLPEHVLNIGAGSWGFLYYLWFFIAGFMIASDERLQKNVTDRRWMSLLLGVVLSTIYLYQLFSPSRVMGPDRIGNWTQSLVYFGSAWCWLCAVLGFGMRFLRDVLGDPRFLAVGHCFDHLLPGDPDPLHLPCEEVRPPSLFVRNEDNASLLPRL